LPFAIHAFASSANRAMETSENLRLLVVCQHDASGRRARFVEALAQRVTLVDVVNPELSRLQRKMLLALTFHPRGARWKGRAGFDGRLARLRTESVQRSLLRHRDNVDLIMQFQTLCAPGHDRKGVPYTIYTDNTMALTQRHYPNWAQISPETAHRWMEHEATVFRRAKAIFTYSEFARRSVIGDYGCSPDAVLAVGAGANQMLPCMPERDVKARPRALFVGFEFERKGGLVLLDAWPQVRRHVPDAELVIAGPRRSPRRNLPAGVRWVGRSDREALSELYRSASLFVMPSRFEPWGHVFLEAMGHGLPCIGTRSCAMPEIIDDGVTGRLVAAGEPEPLAETLVELLADPAKMAQMGRAGYQIVSREHLWANVVDRVMAHLGKQPAPAGS
jgi:glycosyltransferase involved in cell wall biosynthesis